MKFRISLIVLLCMAFVLPGYAQTRRAMLRQFEKKADKALEQGADFVIPPLEQVPESRPLSLSRAGAMAAQTNWGKDLLLPATVLDRMRRECTRPVVLKVMDTAPKIGHLYLQNGQLPGANYTGEAGTDDLNGHGTHCAGIVAARELGIAAALVETGVLKLKPIKILSNAGSGSFIWVEQAILGEINEDKAYRERGTAVVYSGSFGGGTALVSGVEAALKRSTQEAGALFVFAAGNTGGAGVQYPGRSPYGIAVASLDQSPLARSSYSTTGPEVWVGMPGRSINSTYRSNTFAVLSGTSMATPFASALLCIARSKWGPERLSTTADAKAYLKWVCSDIAPTGKDDATGHGIAYVLSVLDKNPTQNPDNGGTPPPNNPPNDPGPPPAPVFPERRLKLPLDGPWVIYWNTIGASLAPTQYSTQQSAPPPGFAAFTVQSVEVLATTKTDLKTTSAAMRAQVNEYFAGRGYGLPAPADGATALYWSAYFLELLLRTEGYTPRVLAIEGTGPSGERIRYAEGDLRHLQQ